MLQHKTADKSKLRLILLILRVSTTFTNTTKFTRFGAKRHKHLHGPCGGDTALFEHQRLFMIHGAKGNKNVQQIVEDARARLGGCSG